MSRSSLGRDRRKAHRSVNVRILVLLLCAAAAALSAWRTRLQRRITRYPESRRPYLDAAVHAALQGTWDDHERRQHLSPSSDTPLTVMLTVANSGAQDLLANLLCSLQHAMNVSIDRRLVLIRTLDDALQSRLAALSYRWRHLRLCPLRSRYLPSMGTYQNMKAHNAGFYAVEREKFRALRDVLHSLPLPTSISTSAHASLYVLLSDIDVAWLRDPFAPTLRNTLADLTLQCDSCAATRYGPQQPQCPFQYNTGIVYMRVPLGGAAARSKRQALQALVAEVVTASETYHHQRRMHPSMPVMHDQQIFDAVVRRWIARGRIVPLGPDPPMRLTYRTHPQALTLSYFPWRWFPNGCVLFGYRQHRPHASARHALHQPDGVVAVHANYRNGYAAKRAALESVGAWRLASATDRASTWPACRS
ncbi:hypothetical protein CDCA_CDCA04G1352 [Cyanidium caldarium]|uniref:Nucleotide-diphospho-sugar transferase domain-containing protein n=1 Tax=Cyanidium caldarium TaxID=2771 RepID=A0AAV9IST9_CYACA|nr:hypothetical protein CDCA_CDCA04G1352 [Cyanidium caldarium]